MNINSIEHFSLPEHTNVSRTEMFLSAAESGDRESFERLLFNQNVDVYEKDCVGKTALMLVAVNGHVECLRCMVEANKIENINERNEENERTVLMMSAMNGHAECVKCLIATRRADVNLRDWLGYTALMYAAENGHVECLKCFEDANAIGNINYVCKRNHSSALMLAAKSGHTECVKCLIDTGQADINLRDGNDYTVLMLVAVSGNVECLKYLVDTNKIENFNQCDSYQRTALMLAAEKGHTECVRCLIDTELADINICDIYGYTALMHVAKNGHVECLNYLVDANKTENINQYDPSQCTALMLAAMNGYTKCVRCLIDSGIADVNLSDWRGNTALIIVASNGHVECLRCLVESNKTEDINQRNKGEERTALMMAAMNGHIECVRYLIDTGQADVNLCDWIGYTALMIAARNGHYECVKYLTMTEGMAINQTDEYGKTALVLAAEKGHLKCLECLVGRRDIDINHHDFDKTTAFMLAARNGHIDCVKLLMSNKMLDLNARNMTGHTAFMLAVNNGHTECVRQLLDRENLDLNARNMKGHSALMLASMNSHIPCVELLLGVDKVDIHTRDYKGHTALSLSILAHHYECARCLIFNKNVHLSKRGNKGMADFLSAIKMPAAYYLWCFFEITLTWEENLINFYSKECDRCAICFFLEGLAGVHSENIPCSHTLLYRYTKELSDFGKNGQTSLIEAIQKSDRESVDFLLLRERMRYHILAILLWDEYFTTGTISLIFYKKLSTLIYKHRDLDQFMYMICNGYEIEMCVDYLLSAFVCHIDFSNNSALSLAIRGKDPTQLKIIIENVSDKIILFNHIEVSCKECPFTNISFPSLLELLKFDIFLWNWYPQCKRDELNALTRELVIRGFAPECFEWQGKESSPIHFAFMSGDEGLVRYLVANLYLTSRDLEHVQRDTEIFEHIHRLESEYSQQLYPELHAMPRRFEILRHLSLGRHIELSEYIHLFGSENLQQLVLELLATHRHLETQNLPRRVMEFLEYIHRLGSEYQPQLPLAIPPLPIRRGELNRLRRGRNREIRQYVQRHRLDDLDEQPVHEILGRPWQLETQDMRQDTTIFEYIHRLGLAENLQRLYRELFDMPWRLEIQSLLILSNWLRKKRNQDYVEKVYSVIPELF